VVDEVVLHPHHVVDAAVLHWLVGLGHCVDGLVETMVLHHCDCSGGEVAHYIHLAPNDAHGEEGDHEEHVDGHHGHEDVDDLLGHEGDGNAHLDVEVARHSHWLVNVLLMHVEKLPFLIHH
jgi:hypothetical protein